MVPSSSPSPLHNFSLMPISSTLGTPPLILTNHGSSSADRGLLLIHLLVNCCNHVAARDFPAANAFLEHISLLASSDGDTMQRMASFFTDALACRLLKSLSLPGVYRALHGTRLLSAAETQTARRHFFDLCPFLKLSVVAANKAIVEAMEGEKMVHVIDLNAWDASQWIALLHMFSCRPEGPPHVRITGVHDRKEILDQTAMQISEAAERLDVPFQFDSVVSKPENLVTDSFRVKAGEALAVSSILQLHPLLASSSDTDVLTTTKTKNPSIVVTFLTMLRSLSPKITVVAEQESSHNRSVLTERFAEALNYYAALFDSLESTVARESPERGSLERLVFGEEIKNIIACEGSERTARHERLERWASRLEAVGFGKVGLSSDALYQCRMMLLSLSFRGFGGFQVEEKNGCFLLCWQNHPLFSVSAWNSLTFI